MRRTAPSRLPAGPSILRALVCIAVCAGLHRGALAGQAGGEGAWRFQYDGLRMMFEAQGLETVTNPAQWAALPASETVLVMMDDLGSVPRSVREPATYLRQGGAMLVASDKGNKKFMSPLGIELYRG